MLKIYGVPISVHTRKVIVSAIEKRLDYENDPVIPFTPPAGWDKLSPTGKIPVVTDGALTLTDSSVICTYLERAYPHNPLYPREIKSYVQALWFEEYADGTLFREVVHGLFYQKIIRPNLLQQKTDAGAIRTIVNDSVPKIFGYLEDALSGEYWAGGQFSVADIAIVSNLVNFHYLGYTIDALDFPKLADYFEERVQHPSIAAALRTEQPVASKMGLERSFFASFITAAV